MQGAPPDSTRRLLADLDDGAARYTFLEAIGEGGMGTVHLALEHGEDGGKKRVAVKRMRPQATKDPRNLELFLREARLATMLRHPNVAHALSFGRIGDEPYIAMEYIEGRTLDAVLAELKAKGRSLDLGEACLIAADLCEGLHAVHSLTDESGRALGVVHRDVTPHNVIVSFDGAVRLLDFGIAKVTEESSKLTRTGEVRGKMAYMSPEQALGERVDARSDLFGVGAVFYECLTGTRMWGEGAELELMRRLALETPPMLPEESGPGELRDLQRALVARKPHDRPQTAQIVAESLRSHIDAHARTRLQDTLLDIFGDARAAEEKRREEVLTRDPDATHTDGRTAQLDAEYTTPAFVQTQGKSRSRSSLGIVGTIGIVVVAVGALAFSKLHPAPTMQAQVAKAAAMDPARELQTAAPLVPTANAPASPSAPVSAATADSGVAAETLPHTSGPVVAKVAGKTPVAAVTATAERMKPTQAAPASSTSAVVPLPSATRAEIDTHPF